MSALADVIQAHCLGEDKQNIDAWIENDVRAFVRSIKVMNQDPRFWSGFGPDGLLKWHNALALQGLTAQ